VDPRVERGDQPGEQVVGGRGERLLVIEEPLDHLTGSGVDSFQGQLPWPALLLKHDHPVGGEVPASDEDDLGGKQGGRSQRSPV
jgi:hypothetical protein